MAEPPSIELNEDMRFQRRSWRAERIAWGVLAIVVLLALAGLFGTGLLSWTTVRAGAVEVAYERLLRVSAPAALTVSVEPGEARRPLAITVDGTFLRVYDIAHVRPEPAEWIAAEGGVRLLFHTTGAGALVQLRLRAQRIGYAAPAVAVNGERPFVLPVFVYP